MKNLRTYLVLLPLCIAFLSHGKNIALVIGQSLYEENETGWTDLNADVDIAVMKMALDLIGFQSENIYIGENLTFKEMNAQFNLMLDKVEKGDHFHFHFSGHGQQMVDNNGDELDGFDEAILPVDANVKMIPNKYVGERHIRDDDINIWLNKIRTKIGASGQVSVTLDACHSGTATRSINTRKHRGSSSVFGYSEGSNSANNDENYFFEFNENEIIQKGVKAPITCLYGSGPNQKNYEVILPNDVSMGSLTYAFYTALKMAQENSSYADIYDLIKVIFVENDLKQQPQIEGELDARIAGSNHLNRNQASIESISGTEITLNKGSLNGFLESVNIKLFNPSDSLQYYDVTVKNSTPFKSTVEVFQNIDNKQDLTKWNAVIQQNAISGVTLDLQLKNNSETIELTNQLNRLDFVSVSNINPSIILKQADENSITVFNTYGEFINTIELSSNPARRWSDVLKFVSGYHRFKFLSQMQSQSEGAFVDFDFLKADVSVYDGAVTINKIGDAISKDLILGDNFLLRIQNNSPKKLYFSLLELQSNYEYSILVPNIAQERSAEEYMVMPGQSLILKNQVFEIYPPFGKDIFMLVASDKPLNFVDILKPYAVRAVSSTQMSQLEEVLSYGLQNTTHGAKKAPAIKKQKVYFSINKKAYNLIKN